jgi:integrase
MRSLSWSSLVKTRIEPGKSVAVVGDPAVYISGQYQLRYRIRASGKIFAQLVYKRAGKWETVTIAPVPMTEAEADVSVTARLHAWQQGGGGRGGLVLGDALEPIRDRARNMLPGLLSGADPRGNDTLRALIDQYLKHRVADLRPRTQVESRRHLLRDWASFHGRPASSLTKGEIADQLFKLKEENGPVAALRSRATLRALYAWAFDADRIEIMPPFPTKRALQYREQSRDRVLAIAELREIWGATAGPGDFNVILRLLVLLGQRRAEVGGMAWRELDLPCGLWSLPASRTKNGRPHLVPLSTQAVALLKALPRREGRDYVFGEGNGGFSGWSRCKARLDARLGLPAWSMHDVRRSWSTHVNKLTGAPHVVEVALNHASGILGDVAGVYNRERYLEERAQAMQRWADYLLG